MNTIDSPLYVFFSEILYVSHHSEKLVLEIIDRQVCVEIIKNFSVALISRASTIKHAVH